MPDRKQLAVVTRAVGLPGVRLNGIGKAVQRIGGKGQHRHEDRIDRDDIGAEAGAKYRHRPEAEL